MRYLLPLTTAATLLWMYRSIEYRRYPALMTYLGVETVAVTATLLGASSVMYVFNPGVRMLVYFLVCCEVFKISCQSVAFSDWFHTLGCSVCSSAFLSFVSAQWYGLELIHAFNLFRQYYRISLALLLVGLSLYRWKYPTIENQEHMAYRVLMTLNFVRMAVSGMFVKKGIGFVFANYTDNVYSNVDRTSWVMATVQVIALGYFMTSSYSSRRRNFYRYPA